MSALLREASVVPLASTRYLPISPVQGWIEVRANLVGTHLSDSKITRSDLEGRFDPLALELAKEVQIAEYFSLEHPNLQPTVLLHVLIYEIADGTMVLSFPQFPEAGGDQLEYWGCARLSVMKKDGKWTEIKGPEGLHGKGWAVRHGFGNRAEAILKMEMKRLPWDG